MSQLHTLDPPGIGARDLRECLLLQLNALCEPELPDSLAYVLIDKYLHQLGQGQLRQIAREIKTSEQEVRRAIQYIQKALHPYPALTYQAIVSAHPTIAIHIHPDIIIRKVDTGYEVELIEEQRYRFSIASGYGTQPLSFNDETMNEEVQRYFRHYSNRATFFIDCVHRRWQTFKRIAMLLVNYQSEFLEQGVRYLRPLTQSVITDGLNLDEGTVSRAIANKYALLPDGSLMPLSNFFDASLSVKDMIRELISLENLGNRLSDEELARSLTVRGIPIARRTVTKYREDIGILSSRERGSL